VVHRKGFYIMYKMRLVIIAAFISNLRERFIAVMPFDGIVQPHEAQIGFGAKAGIFFKLPVELTYRQVKRICQFAYGTELFGVNNVFDGGCYRIIPESST